MLSVSVVGWLTKRNLFAAVKPGQWTQPSTEDQTHSPPSAWKHLRERGLFSVQVYSVQLYIQCTTLQMADMPYWWLENRHHLVKAQTTVCLDLFKGGD